MNMKLLNYVSVILLVLRGPSVKCFPHNEVGNHVQAAQALAARTHGVMLGEISAALGICWSCRAFVDTF